LLDRIQGQRQDLVPPRSQIFTGNVDDFKSSGDALVAVLVETAGLTPQSRVLDIGSGLGRLAVGLTTYLDEAGSYDGIDIVPSGVRWCAENITPRFPNFMFTLADIYNKEYNPDGRLKASEYQFPYPDDQFDLVVLRSVYTHMLPEDVEHYVSEVTRMLRPGGRCYATYSLIDEEVMEAMAAGRTTLRMQSRSDPAWVVDPKVPELAVGYEESYVRELYQRYGLVIDKVLYGSWSRRPRNWAMRGQPQDIVITAKPQ
jgi:SAM-dependent methyltransferase